MILKKKKAVIAAILSAALAAAAMMPTVSAAGTRTKEEAYGDSTYAQRFLSLYDDVITNGVANGYLKEESGTLGIPYHAVEELIIEAPDYGHETTSEAMSYIVWMAAMRDHISRIDGVTKEDGSAVDQTNDLAKAWKSMEVMIPSVGGYGTDTIMSVSSLSAQYAEEKDTPEEYPVPQSSTNTGQNPIHSTFRQVYSSDSGLYLMHWLADVDDWYGYGGGNGEFTFINTFQRGSQESCWETIPHASVETLKYGNSRQGVKGVFDYDCVVNGGSFTASYSYTNAPDAEDRAIQAIYAANRWGVGDSSISALAGKMGDELRNNMFDKYYKAIGANSASNNANSYDAAHYLMSWYTSWGGALDNQWAWQIGASHCHEFYQNPLAAYALLADDELRAGMKTGSQAIQDYQTSLQRQLEFYLWLQSADGPIAGGATSSWNGRYDTPSYTAEEAAKYGSSTPTTFYGMSYLEHPVYLDPGSNHWIGNQVWAIQRLAELYYVVKTEGESSYAPITTTTISSSGTIEKMTIEDALEAILDRWVEWFVDNVKLYDDGSYAIPASLDWYGQPATWTGTYDPDANSSLTCEITAYGSSDLGCVSSLCNTLIYYAKCNDVDTEAAYQDSDVIAEKALYLAHSLLDREWELGRDDIGLSISETNGSMIRLFTQDVWVPTGYSGNMPNGDPIENGATFLSIRSQYLGDNGDGTNSDGSYTDNRGYVKQFYDAYNSVGATSKDYEDLTADELAAYQEAMQSVELNYHRFWHAGDILIALGTMYDLYPDVEPDKYNDEENPDTPFSVNKESITVEVDGTDTITPSVSGCTFESADTSIATVDSNGVVTGVAEGETTVTVTSPDGDTVTVKVTVTAEATIPTGSFNPDDLLYGDVNLDEAVTTTDIVVLSKYLINTTKYELENAQAYEQAQTVYDGVIDTLDSMAIVNYVIGRIEIDDLGPAR